MKKILINDNPWQTRIAITRDNALENIYFSEHATQTLERAFYKSVVTKVLPGIQTAFVDIGQERAGFLHISEIDRELAINKISKSLQFEDDDQSSDKKRQKQAHKQRIDIAKIVKEGEPLLVQVSKEPVYEKGAKLTTCFTLPGRFVVLMPNIPRIGVSKKIDNRDERHRLKTLVRKSLPDGMGAIIRTTSADRDERDIIKDINYLVTTWNNIQTKFANGKVKERLHEDLPLSLQIVRDHLDDDVESVVVDNKEMQQSIYKFVKAVAPEHSHKIKLYRGKTNLFSYYGVDKQIKQAIQKKVNLPSGGSLIIETTEAMTVIDVNTGRFIGKSNLEETIFKTNTEAAQEVSRQLRIRNIGGLIVIDFIDMALHSNRQKLFRFFEKLLRERDKFQSVVLKISEFGIVQMTRKRSGKTLNQQLMQDCPTCHTLGFIPSVQSDAYLILRTIKQEFKTQKPSKKVTIKLNPAVFEYISSTEYNAILELEKELDTKITLSSNKQTAQNEYKIEKK